MKIYKNFINPAAFVWPETLSPLDRSYRPEVPDELRVDDSKVLVTRIEGNPRFVELEKKILKTLVSYGRDHGYEITGLAMVGYSEFHKHATLPWHLDHYPGYEDDRMLTMSIQVQAAEMGGGLQFENSRKIEIEDGDAIIFDSRLRHRSTRVISGTRKIVVSFGTGVKL